MCLNQLEGNHLKAFHNNKSIGVQYLTLFLAIYLILTLRVTYWDDHQIVGHTVEGVSVSLVECIYAKD